MDGAKSLIHHGSLETIADPAPRPGRATGRGDAAGVPVGGTGYLALRPLPLLFDRRSAGRWREAAGPAVLPANQIARRLFLKNLLDYPCATRLSDALRLHDDAVSDVSLHVSLLLVSSWKQRTAPDFALMDPAEMRVRVRDARVGRLATLGADGRPHLVPICFALEGETLYSAVDEKPKRSKRLQRLENIRRHPEVTVLVDQYEEDWTRLWWVRLDGTATVHEAGPERERGLELLGAKYEQYRAGPPTGPVIAVRIESWRGWRS
jgi:PPOX class probable F420-dependent enzyme